MDADVETDTEVLGKERAHSITFKYHLSLKEVTLWDTRVNLLGLDDHDWLILKVVVNEDRVNSEIFKTAFNDWFFEVAEEAENLFVELNKGGFKLFVNVAANVVHVLGLGEWLAGVGLLGTEVGCWGVGHRVKWHFDILTVSVFFKLDVAHFLVRDNSWIVCGHVSREFWEVGSHIVCSMNAGDWMQDWLQVEKVNEYFITI